MAENPWPVLRSEFWGIFRIGRCRTWRFVHLRCGHGGVTDRIAARVGDSGAAYAVDASADQLRIGRSPLAHRRNVTFIEGVVDSSAARSQAERLALTPRCRRRMRSAASEGNAIGCFHRVAQYKWTTPASSKPGSVLRRRKVVQRCPELVARQPHSLVTGVQQSVQLVLQAKVG
jgi:hypothetical protein